jgi:hypothetical protein
MVKVTPCRENSILQNDAVTAHKKAMSDTQLLPIKEPSPASQLTAHNRSNSTIRKLGQSG